MSSSEVEAAQAATSEPLAQQVADLHKRLHLSDVRLQKLHAEAFTAPPFDVDHIQVVSPSEYMLQPPRLAARFSQTVTLKDEQDESLAEVTVVLVIDYDLDEGPSPSSDAVSAYVEHNSYFTAHPYLREHVQNATLKLGLEPVVLGILSRDQPRPLEVTLVRRHTFLQEAEGDKAPSIDLSEEVAD